MVRRMSHAEHPLVAAHRPHAAPDLVGEGLKGDALIYDRQRAGDGVAGAGAFLRCQENFQGLLEPPLQQVFKTPEGNHARRRCGQFARQMKPVDRVEEKQGAHALVQIIAGAPEGVQLRAGGDEFSGRGLFAEGVQRLVANRGIRRGDDFDERAGHAFGE